ncbi:MAG: hypothetical protein F4Z31_05310 [Gemmatimonadetes bacterium]|nr:hypothetical protein [Gemmatimonadota bacterium]MYF08813.1 hypothetical protein [Rhodospirillaceae bacterium]
MTPETFLKKGAGQQLAIAIGPGIPLGIAGYLGTSVAKEDWYPVADEVLKAAMTPVAVLAAAAIVVFNGAVGGSAGAKDGEGRRSLAITLAAIVYVLMTTLYFISSLATIAVPDDADAKDDLVEMSFGLLGVVLGSMVAIVVLLVMFHQSESAESET